MEQIDYDIDDFMNYCEVKNLSKKTITSYEQTLRLFALYIKNEYNLKEAGDVKEIHIREYIKHLQERGKYTVVVNENYVRRTILLPADNTKGKKDRYVFFSAEMLKELKRWLQYKDRYKQSDYIFCTTKGTNLKVSNFETNFTKYGERIGKKDIHPHMLRNNFAKRFLMSGGDIYTLSKILGHFVNITEEQG